MAKFISKADASFRKKSAKAIENRNFGALERVYHQYGCYLELIDAERDLTRDEVKELSQASRTLVRESNSSDVLTHHSAG